MSEQAVLSAAGVAADTFVRFPVLARISVCKANCLSRAKERGCVHINIIESTTVISVFLPNLEFPKAPDAVRKFKFPIIRCLVRN